MGSFFGKKRERSCYSCVCATWIKKQVLFHPQQYTHNYGNSSLNFYSKFCYSICETLIWVAFLIFLMYLIRVVKIFGTRVLIHMGVELPWIFFIQSLILQNCWLGASEGPFRDKETKRCETWRYLLRLNFREGENLCFKLLIYFGVAKFHGEI